MDDSVVTVSSSNVREKSGREAASVILQVPIRPGNPRHAIETIEKLVDSLTTAGLDTVAFQGLPNKKGIPSDLFLEITGSNARLLEEAERTRLLLPLNEKALGDADHAMNQDLARKGLKFFPADEDKNLEHANFRIDPSRRNRCLGLCWSVPVSPYVGMWAPLVSDVYPYGKKATNIPTYAPTAAVLSRAAALSSSSPGQMPEELLVWAATHENVLYVQRFESAGFASKVYGGYAWLESTWVRVSIRMVTPITGADGSSSSTSSSSPAALLADVAHETKEEFALSKTHRSRRLFAWAYKMVTGAMGNAEPSAILLVEKYLESKTNVKVNPSLYSICKETGFLLNPAQALRMLLSILESDTEVGGANLDLDKMASGKGKIIKKWFSPHLKGPDVGRELIQRNWKLFPLPRTPLTDIKNYYAEKVGFYYAFLSHYISWILIPAVVGLGVYVDMLVKRLIGVPYLVVFAIIVALWSTFFVEAWKRRQSYFASRWGMETFRAAEPDRPEFEDMVTQSRCCGRESKAFVRSHIDGKPDLNFSGSILKLKTSLTSTATMTALGVVIVIVGSIFILRAQLVSKQDAIRNVPGWPDYATSLINALQIQLLNYVYPRMATWLTDFEGHRKQSTYDDSLVLKLSIFQCINSYFGLIYIAAIKNNIVLAGRSQACALAPNGQPDCMGELQSQLAILMLLRLVSNIVFNIVIPYLWRTLKPLFRTRCIKVEDAAAARAQEAIMESDPIELQADLAAYDTFNDYLNLTLQFGFISLFVIAFPLAPFIALVDALVAGYGDRKRMFHDSARCSASGANGIGSWLLVFESLAVISAITNLAVVSFADQSPIFGQDWNPSSRVIFFIIAEHIVLLLKHIASTYISDTPSLIEDTRQRQTYLVGKHFFGVKDLILNKQSSKSSATASSSSTAADNSPDDDSATAVVTGDITSIAGVQMVSSKVVIKKNYFDFAGLPDPRVAGTSTGSGVYSSTASSSSSSAASSSASASASPIPASILPTAYNPYSATATGGNPYASSGGSSNPYAATNSASTGPQMVDVPPTTLRDYGSGV